MDWSKKIVMEFLDLYEGEPVLWDPKHLFHRDRSQLHEAWIRMQNRFSVNCSVDELKKKKDAILATYRKLKIKMKRNEESGCAAKVVKPKWFAYEKIDSFLRVVYIPKGIQNIQILQIERTDAERVGGDEGCSYFEVSTDLDIDPLASPTVQATELINTPVASIMPNQVRQPVEKNTDVETVEERIVFNQVGFEHSVHKDDCSLFCELLCWKLRALDEDTRELAMHEINMLMFNMKQSSKRQPHPAVHIDLDIVKVDNQD